MSSEANKALYRRFVEEVMSRGNIAAIDELMAADFVEHEYLAPGIPMNREGVKQLFAIYHRAFSDIHVNIDDEIAEDDKVVVRLTVRGTQTGELFGIPPTGKQVAFQAIDITRIAGDQLVEHWGTSDQLGMFQQLGVIPPLGKAAR
jgi:predicted ester cyclase